MIASTTTIRRCRLTLALAAACFMLLTLPLAAVAEGLPETESKTGSTDKTSTTSTCVDTQLAIVPCCARGESAETPGLSCIMQTFGNIARLILSITGGAALLMFVYGGFNILASGGRESMVSKGKDAITAAVIGIVIILLAGYLIDFGLTRVGVQPNFLATPSAADDAKHTETETETKTETKTP